MEGNQCKGETCQQGLGSYYSLLYWGLAWPLFMVLEYRHVERTAHPPQLEVAQPDSILFFLLPHERKKTKCLPLQLEE